MSAAELFGVAAVSAVLVALACLEVSLRSLSRLQLRDWAERTLGGDDDEKEGVLPPTQGLEVTLIALRLARQTTLVGLAVLAYRLVQRLDLGAAAWVAFGVALGLYLLLDKVVSYGLVSWVGADRALRGLGFLVKLVRGVFGPAATLLHGTLRRNRSRIAEGGEVPHDKGLGAFLDLVEEEGWVTEREEALLRGVAQFGEAVVREVMTPRVDIVCVDAGADLAELRRMVSEEHLSRIPVIRKNIDNVVGVVHIKDLVAALEEGRDEAPVTSIARPALFVPETKSIRDLLREFQRRRAQLAIVVDEYGGTAGLVTLEDILEEIVGEIQDETEPPEEQVAAPADGVLETVGKAEIDDVERALGVEIEDGEFETVGGLVFTELGRVPKAGESFDYGDLRIEVLEADERRVQRVRITRR